MASKSFDPVRAYGKEFILYAGAFKFNNTATPTTVQGKGFTIARSTAGTHTITLNANFNEILTVIPVLERDDATTAIYDINFKRSSTSSNVFTLQTYTDDGDGSGTVEDIAAGSNHGNWCHFLIVAKNTSVGSTA